MVDVRGILGRFKPAGAPGPSTGAAVPADRAAERAAELQPLFASLEVVEAEARVIRCRAVQEAAAIRDEARRRAETIVGEAVGRAAIEQDRSEHQARAAAEESCAALVDQARARAESLRARARTPVHDYVDRIVTQFADALRETASPRARPRSDGPEAAG